MYYEQEFLESIFDFESNKKVLEWVYIYIILNVHKYKDDEKHIQPSEADNKQLFNKKSSQNLLWR